MSRRPITNLRKLFIVVTIPVISLCATFVVLYVSSPTHKKEISTSVEALPVLHETTTPQPLMSTPIKLKIGTIDVDAPINPVGTTTAGDMDIDENPEQLAWYKLGPKPGEEGSAVIAGHYGWKNGVPSVFNDLNKLVVGDEVTAYGEDGREKVFVVTRIALYTPDQDATDIFRSDDGKSHLNLITCQGSWNTTEQTYSERLVIFTDYLR